MNIPSLSRISIPQGPEREANHAKRPTRAPEELDRSEKETLRELQRRDQEVRQHEQAHKAAAGTYARGGARFDYQRGPDGHLYAVGGEVNIDVSPIEGDPQATIKKMNQVKSAALAPNDPSRTDRSIAASASREISKAQRELRAHQPSGHYGSKPLSPPEFINTLA